MASGGRRGGVPACRVYVRCISAQLGPDASAPTRARVHFAAPLVHVKAHTHTRARLAVPLPAPFTRWVGSAMRQQTTPSPGGPLG